MAHMREDVDRGVGDEFDIVGAARQRAFDVAGIEYVEEIQHALPMQGLGHAVFLRGCLCPTGISGLALVAGLCDQSP